MEQSIGDSDLFWTFLSPRGLASRLGSDCFLYLRALPKHIFPDMAQVSCVGFVFRPFSISKARDLILGAMHSYTLPM